MLEKQRQADKSLELTGQPAWANWLAPDSEKDPVSEKVEGWKGGSGNKSGCFTNMKTQVEIPGTHLKDAGHSEPWRGTRDREVPEAHWSAWPNR